ncbi:MAG: hypothetical protein EZS28_001187 [Streblomastix strix]|uniref:Uncharacterized protein n=1 Tax=Streblomastix strix TaxID=222440 RepID=A0A5J4X9N2_9EUKA|nr:MAG: hypothetical protein EZS28_001187 [Streblomastix strix]
MDNFSQILQVLPLDKEEELLQSELEKILEQYKTEINFAEDVMQDISIEYGEEFFDSVLQGCTDFESEENDCKQFLEEKNKNILDLKNQLSDLKKVALEASSVEQTSLLTQKSTLQDQQALNAKEQIILKHQSFKITDIWEQLVGLTILDIQIENPVQTNNKTILSILFCLNLDIPRDEIDYLKLEFILKVYTDSQDSTLSLVEPVQQQKQLINILTSHNISNERSLPGSLKLLFKSLSAQGEFAPIARSRIPYFQDKKNILEHNIIEEQKKILINDDYLVSLAILSTSENKAEKLSSSLLKKAHKHLTEICADMSQLILYSYQ